MKTLIISDTHFGNHEDFANYNMAVNSRLLLQIQAFCEALQIGIREKCDRVIHLGDVFHKRGQVEPEAFNLCKQSIEKYAARFGRIIVLTGNHDITMEGEVFNTAYMLEDVAQKVDVITAPTRGNGEYFIPFMKEGFEEALKVLGSPSGVTLYMHQSIFGAHYNRPILKGVDPAFLKGFKRVFCGHIHEPQTIKPNIWIVGAPYPMNFGDKEKHHVLIIDESSNIGLKYPIKHPKFLTVEDPGDIRDDGNFYRFVTDDPREAGSASNVRVVLKPKLKTGRKIRGTTDRELLEQYAQREGVEAKDLKKMVDTGMIFLGGK